MTKNIVVIGSANTDMVAQVPSIPAPGETISAQDFMVVQGGKGANQAVAAARLGHSTVNFIACLGNDGFAEQAITAYQQDGIDTSTISRVEESSGVALIFVSDEGENSIAVVPGANGCLHADHVIAEKAKITQADCVLLQLEVPLPTVLAAIDVAYDAGVPVVLNPAPAQALPAEALAKVSTITPNETEAEILTGIAVTDENSAKCAAEKLLSFGVDQVIITLGKQGAFWANSDNAVMVPGFSVDAVDTTAAGDSFNGALVVALSEQKGMIDAIEFANAAAALSVTGRGAQPSIPNREKVDKFLSSIR